MSLFGVLAKLRNALRQKESAGYQDYAAEHRREEREQTTLNLLAAEVGDRRADRQEGSRYRKSQLLWTRATFLVSLITMAAVIYYAWVAKGQLDESHQQLVTARRPWVAFSEGAPHVGPLVFDNNGASVNVSISIKNWGLSPSGWSQPEWAKTPRPPRERAGRFATSIPL